MTPDIYSAMLLFQSFHKRDNDGNATNFAETLYICAIQELHSFTSGLGFQPVSDRIQPELSCRSVRSHGCRVDEKVQIVQSGKSTSSLFLELNESGYSGKS